MSYPFLTSIDMNGNQLIQTLCEVLGTDPTTLLNEGRFWVNSTTHKFIVYLNGAKVSFYGDTTTLDNITKAAADLDINTHKIINVVDPTAAQHAATKNYVDTRKLSDFVAPSADVSMGSHKLTLVTDPTSAQDASTKAYVDARRLDQAAAPTGDVSLNSHKITNLLDPTGAQDAASKNYVDTLSQGLAPKESVRIATTANIATNGLAAIDGVTPVAGNRILVKNQSGASGNGIYVAASGTWTRATDADSATDLESAFVFVEEGTLNADTMWIQTADNILFGSDDIIWVQFANVTSTTAGNGLSLAGTVLAVNVDGQTIEINSDTLRVKAGGITTNELGALAATDAKINDVAASKITGNVPVAHGGTGSATAAAARTALGTASVYAATITGDGSTTAFNVDHTLNTKDVLVQVWDILTDKVVGVDLTRSTVNRVIVTFSTAPVGGGTPQTYRIVVMAIA